MPEYKFGEHQDENKSKKSPKDSQNSRTIPVHSGEISFDLGAKPATLVDRTSFPEKPNAAQPAAPSTPKTTFPDKKLFTEIPTSAPSAKTSTPLHQKIAGDSRRAAGIVDAASHIQKTFRKSTAPAMSNTSTLPKTPSRVIFNKIWNGLEFVAVTAAIFMVLFFFINYQSYSQLFLTKLDLLKNQLNQNPYTEQQAVDLKNASPEGQKPLPIVSNPQAAKRQVPELSMEVAPPDERVIIPRIGQNVPIVQIPTDTLIRRDWKALEKQIQEALRNGVVHFPGTAYPGEPGNVVITGHSSYFPWDPGRFKDVFALLHQVNIGDQVIVYHDQKKYVYQVYDKKVVKPTEISVLTQAGDTHLTLITCTPVGTDLNRLVILAKPVSAS